MWFKADTLKLTNNAPISLWNPSGGAVAGSLGQSSFTNQPIFQTAQQNGLPAVLFDGVSSCLTNGTYYWPPACQPLTFFLVYRFTGPENNGYMPAFFGNAPSGGAWWIGEYGTEIGSYFGNAITSGVPSDPNWHILMYVINGANSKYRMDNGADTSILGSLGTNYINSLEVGGQATNTWTFANVYVGEILIYSGDQSTNESAIFSYLDSRWAILEAQANPPFAFHWTDRRPIGMDGLAGGVWANSKNPRGWFGPNLDCSSPTGLVFFATNLLTRAANEVSILTNMNAQGVIIWDIEGQEFTRLCFIGDPTKVPVLAPEMDAVADRFFATYTSAGLRVGVTLRPQTFGAGASLPSGTNGNVYSFDQCSLWAKSLLLHKWLV